MDIKDKMKILMELYEKDKELIEIKNIEKEVPEKIKNLDDELNELKEKLTEEEDSLEDIDSKRLELEREIEEQKLILKRFVEQKDQVHTNKEFLALKREIENTEKKIVNLEDQLIDVYLENEEQEKITNEIREVFNNRKEAIEKTKESIKKELHKSKEDLIIKEDERKRIAARLRDERLLHRYERLKESRGSGVSIIEDEICSECHSTIPPQIFAEVRKADKIITCHSCGRILIYRWIE
jgi:hypothetical protein